MASSPVGRVALGLFSGGLSEQARAGIAGGTKAIGYAGQVVDEATGAKAERERGNRELQRQGDIAQATADEQRKRFEEEESTDRLLRERGQARSRQKQRTAGSSGRRDTILTGPLGVVGGGPAGGGKSLLGA